MLGLAATTRVDAVDESPKLRTEPRSLDSTDFTIPVAAGVLDFVVVATRAPPASVDLLILPALPPHPDRMTLIPTFTPTDPAARLEP
jgi:hypothetical protein